MASTFCPFLSLGSNLLLGSASKEEAIKQSPGGLTSQGRQADR